VEEVHALLAGALIEAPCRAVRQLRRRRLELDRRRACPAKMALTHRMLLDPGQQRK